MMMGLRRAVCIVVLNLISQVGSAQPPAHSENDNRLSGRRHGIPSDLPTPANSQFELPKVPVSPSTTQIEGGYAIRRYAFSGNTMVDSEMLEKIAQEFTGQHVSVAQLEELRQRLTRYYIDQGYVNSGAIVPDKPLRDGVFHFQIIEGKLDELHISGQGRLRESYIANRLTQGADDPLNITQLEHNVRRLLADPMIAKVNGHLRPGNALGQAVLDVEVTRARPYQLSLFANNFRPPSVGAETLGVSGWVRNLTGLGDYLAMNFTLSEGSNRYSGTWNFPVNDYGTQVFFRFDEGSFSVVEEPLNAADINSQIHILEGGISHPVSISLDKQLTLGALFAVRENDTQLLGEPFSFVRGWDSGSNKATVLRLSQEYLQSFTRQSLALRSTFSVGLNALGSVQQRDRHNPDSEFFAWMGQATYTYRVMDNGAQVVVRGDVQLSDDPLLPLEQIAVGGYGSVRGYRQNQLVRDEGYSGTIEFQYPVFNQGSHRLILIPFMDYGRAWNHGEGSSYLHSVGIGFQWGFDRLHTDFYWGYPIKSAGLNRQNNLQDKGIFFQVWLDAFQ